MVRHHVHHWKRQKTSTKLTSTTRMWTIYYPPQSLYHYHRPCRHCLNNNRNDNTLYWIQYLIMPVPVTMGKMMPFMDSLVIPILKMMILWSCRTASHNNKKNRNDMVPYRYLTTTRYGPRIHRHHFRRYHHRTILATTTIVPIGPMRHPPWPWPRPDWLQPLWWYTRITTATLLHHPPYNTRPMRRVRYHHQEWKAYHVKWVVPH